MSVKVLLYKNKLNVSLDFKALFEELKNLSFPVFKYKQGNCHNMVHFYSMILNKKAIKHKKIWIYAPVRYDPESRECIIKPDPNQLSLSGRLKWGYHVAIIFDEGIDAVIFDPMLNEEKPLGFAEWVESMNISEYKIFVEQSEKYLFFNSKGEEQVTEFKYFKYNGKSKNNNWVPRGLAVNETAYTFSVLENQTLRNPNENTKDYKRLVGSVINFECVFRDQSFNHRVTLEFQERYSDLIKKYRALYESNLEKWIEIVARFN